MLYALTTADIQPVSEFTYEALCAMRYALCSGGAAILRQRAMSIASRMSTCVCVCVIIK
jgi:hypothetical protein